MLTPLLISLSILCICCKSKPVIKNQSSERSKVQVSAEKKSYNDIKIEIGKEKTLLRDKWEQLSSQEKSHHFSTTITSKIIPYWYGTRWDFNGMSRTPGQGTIACGYFVTTILQDAGLNVQRTRLAQCASEQMIRELVNKRYIRQFRNTEMNTFLSEIKLQGTGVFIIGLDNHTGFLFNDGYTIYFIYSSYINSIGVIKEKAIESPILFYSKYKVTGKISDDEAVLAKWIGTTQ